MRELGPYRQSARPDEVVIDLRSAIQSGEWRSVLTISAGLLLIAAGSCPPELFWGDAVFFAPFAWIAGATISFAGLGVLAVALRDRLRPEMG